MTSVVFDSLLAFQNDKMFEASHSFLAQDLELAIFSRNLDFFQWEILSRCQGHSLIFGLERISRPFQKMEIHNTFFVCLRQNIPWTLLIFPNSNLVLKKLCKHPTILYFYFSFLFLKILVSNDINNYLFVLFYNTVSE